MIEDILAYNQSFVERKAYEKYITSKYPDKKIAVVSCMDTRLTELLPAALGLKNGDAKIIKNAGGIIDHPFGSAMRSLLIAIYELDVREILVVGHTDCGARNTDHLEMIAAMKERGVAQADIDMIAYCGIDFKAWLDGFQDLESSVKKSVGLVKNHPLVPADIKVYGLVLDSVTGALTKIV